MKYTLQSALAQIKACEYKCEGGKLEDNAAFVWLEEQAKKKGLRR